MSLLNKVFGKKKTEKSLSLPEAIQQLKSTEELLLKKQSYLEAKIEKEVALAKKNAAKNKKAALEALQRKKRYEKQLQQIDGTLTTIEAQREVLESANTNTVVVSTIKDAANAIEKTNKFLDPDHVNKLLDDLADQKDINDDIANAISQPVPFADDIDDDELEKELEDLQLEDDLVLDPRHQLPSVPATDIETTKEKEREKPGKKITEKPKIEEAV